jgi:hypothetical protein
MEPTQYPQLAFRVRDLPYALRDLPDRVPLAAHGMYNAVLLSSEPSNATEKTLEWLRRKHILEVPSTP